MNDKISKETRDLIESAFSSITDNDVNVPSFYKKVFNFQGKKSFLVAQKIIKQTTNPNALIYDPFFGSGSFLVAAANEGRKIIGTELDNYTFFSVKTLLQKCNLQNLNYNFNKIKALVFEYIMSLYSTHCTCGTLNHIYKLHFDPQTNEYINPTPHRDIKDGENIIFVEKCPVCGKKAKKCTSEDIEKIKQTDQLDSSAFPHHSLIENSRINITESRGANKYDTNFTNRAKLALLKLQNAISTLPNSIEKDVIELALVFSLPLSKVNMYGSGTNNLYHVIMYSAQEMNVWSIFELKYRALIKYKENLESILQNDFSGNDKIELHNCDYQSFLSNCNLQFDEIYTDPPYTDQVPYLEYQQLYRDWLRLFYDKRFSLTENMLKKEIVITNAPSRKDKNFENYITDIDTMFSLFCKHVKDNGFVFLTIKLGEKKYFNVLPEFVELANKNGFSLVSKYALENDDPTIRKQAAYLSTISTQVILCFQKLPKDKTTWYISNINIEKLVIETCYKEIKESKSNYSLEQDLILKIRNTIFQKSAITLSADELEKVQILINKYFIVRENSFVLLNPNELYIGLEDQASLFVKLLDIVPVLINKLLSKHGKFTLDDLYTEMASILLCGYDQSLLDSFLKDPNYKSQIINLISNYCQESNNVYVKKQLTNIASKNAQDISCMDGYQFEELIQKLLIAQGYKNVVRIGGAGDRGVDLIAVNPSTKQKTIFQCKRWIGDVGSDPIQRLHSFMTMEKAIKDAVCITTSNYTKEGKIIASKTGVKTINGYQLLDLLNQFFPGKYYHGALKSTK